MSSNQREILLKTYRFQSPETIPVQYGLWGSSFLEDYYDQDHLWELIEAYPVIAQRVRRPPRDAYPLRFAPYSTAGEHYVDPWGSVWETHMEGATGQVVKFPFEDGYNLENLKVPDPEITNGRLPVDWQAYRNKVQETLAAGLPASGMLPHGHTFLRLCDLRGYENVLCDMLEEDQDFQRLLEINTAFNMRVVHKLLEAPVDMLQYPEDLGMQLGPMLSPEMFRRWIVPQYQTLMQPAKERGVIVHMHSDGDLRTLMEDILACGIDVINCQEDAFPANWLAENVRGRVAIHLSLSAKLLVTASPEAIHDYIWNCVKTLALPEGGLSLGGQLAPGVPFQNIKALFSALQEVADTPLSSITN